MEKPEHIPEDIWKMAIECADVVAYKYWVGVKAIATTLLTERDVGEISTYLPPDELARLQAQKNELMSRALNEIRDLGEFVAERKGKE